MCWGRGYLFLFYGCSQQAEGRSASLSDCSEDRFSFLVVWWKGYPLYTFKDHFYSLLHMVWWRLPIYFQPICRSYSYPGVMPVRPLARMGRFWLDQFFIYGQRNHLNEPSQTVPEGCKPKPRKAKLVAPSILGSQMALRSYWNVWLLSRKKMCGYLHAHRVLYALQGLRTPP